jgi:hypothetical protein
VFLPPVACSLVNKRMEENRRLFTIYGIGGWREKIFRD